jgi:hypothetical protein
MRDEHPQFIDLHGYRKEEVDDLFDGIRAMILSEFKKGNSKLETTKIGSTIFCSLKAMTGKGLHSKCNTKDIQTTKVCLSQQY